jgi:hypothetical protein
MSSAYRSLATRKEALTRFVKPESPCYNNGSDIVLFPFTCVNQVLDISYAGNNFESVMVDTTGVGPDDETDSSISILGGLYLATSLGENFKAYIRAWRSGTIDAGSRIDIVVAPQLLRVQEVSVTNVTANSSSSVTVRTEAPSGENYITGNTDNSYQTTFVFKTPLTVSIFEGGVKKYITFRTALDQE